MMCVWIQQRIFPALYIVCGQSTETEVLWESSTIPEMLFLGNPTLIQFQRLFPAESVASWHVACQNSLKRSSKNWSSSWRPDKNLDAVKDK